MEMKTQLENANEKQFKKWSENPLRFQKFEKWWIKTKQKSTQKTYMKIQLENGNKIPLKNWKESL